MKYLYLLSLLFIQLIVLGQRTFHVRNIDTKENISFPRADLNGKPLMRGDIDGIILLPKETAGILKISAFEFKDTTFIIENYLDSIVYIKNRVRELEGTIVRPGENPAHRIIELVIANKGKNDPLQNDDFTYNAYNRFVVQADPDHIKSMKDTAKSLEIIEKIKNAQERYMFLSETFTERSFSPPFRDKELITDYRVSGFKDPLLSLLSTQMQSFSFYDNQFTIMEKNYLNPIAAGGTRRYLFVLEDSTFHGKDTTYGISFRPRKGTSFDGLKGMIYINTNGYAVEKVIASPKDTTTLMNIKITQEYKYNGKKWFPNKLISELAVAYQINNIAPMQVKSVSEIKNVNFNPENLSIKNDNYVIDLAENADQTTAEQWKEKRGVSLSKQEQATYGYMDSIGKSKNWDKKIIALEGITTGKLPLFNGKIALDLNRILRYNDFEKVRIGLGIETGKNLMKRIKFGGYFGYGIRDKGWKFGGHSIFNLNPKNQGNLNISYKQDIAERGVTNFASSSYQFGASSFYRTLYARFFDKERNAKVSYSFYPRANVYINTLLSFQRVENTQGYHFINRSSTATIFETAIDQKIKGFDNFMAGFELKWNIREKALRLVDKRYALPTLWPMIRLQVLKAMPAVFGSELNFWRFAAEIEETVNIRAVGRLRMLATAGTTLGNAPLMYQHTALGTGGKFSLSVPNTFETAQPGEFYNDQQACFFTRLTFKAFETNRSWFRPQISLHHALGFGSMREKNRQETLNSFKTMDKGLFEGGIIIDGLLANRFTSLGIGLIQRYGTYSNSDELKNITYKIALKFLIE
jgi:hypothetical protein